MYIPAPFAETRTGVLHDFVGAHPFATMVSTGDDGLPFATHLPLLLDAGRGPLGTLRGHLARSNPHAAHLAAGREALAIFHGPHAYVSPKWYATAPSVPTWNYAVVHAYGLPSVTHDPAAVRDLLEATVKAFEAPDSRWSMSALPERYFESMAAGVVAFELPIGRLEGKFKLSQNRTPVDRDGVIRNLRVGDAEARAVAGMMTGS